MSAIRKNRHMIYVGEDLRKILGRTKEPLSSTVNLLAERYLGMIERAGRTPPYCMNGQMYEAVLQEIGHPLSSLEIAAFPALCEDWLKRHGEFPQGPGSTAVMILKNSPFLDLVALIYEMEQQS